MRNSLFDLEQEVLRAKEQTQNRASSIHSDQTLSSAQTYASAMAAFNVTNSGWWEKIVAIEKTGGEANCTTRLRSKKGKEIYIKGAVGNPVRVDFAHNVLESYAQVQVPKVKVLTDKEIAEVISKFTFFENYFCKEGKTDLATFLQQRNANLFGSNSQFAGVIAMNGVKGKDIGNHIGEVGTTEIEAIFGAPRVWYILGRLMAVDTILGNEDRLERCKLDNLLWSRDGQRNLAIIAIDNDARFYGKTSKIALEDYLKIAVLGEEATLGTRSTKIMGRNQGYSPSTEALSMLELIAGDLQKNQKLYDHSCQLRAEFRRIIMDAWQGTKSDLSEPLANYLPTSPSPKDPGHRAFLEGIDHARKALMEKIDAEKIFKGYEKYQDIWFDPNVLSLKKQYLTLRETNDEQQAWNIFKAFKVSDYQ